MFLLEQGESDEAKLEGKGRAAVSIFNRAREKAFQNGMLPVFADETRNKKLILQNICNMVNAVPCHRLTVSRTGRFWEEMERALLPGGNA